jgi:hypothetical protein
VLCGIGERKAHVHTLDRVFVNLGVHVSKGAVGYKNRTFRVPQIGKNMVDCGKQPEDGYIKYLAYRGWVRRHEIACLAAANGVPMNSCDRTELGPRHSDGIADCGWVTRISRKCGRVNPFRLQGCNTRSKAVFVPGEKRYRKSFSAKFLGNAGRNPRPEPYYDNGL